MVLDKRYRIFFHKKQLIINTKKYICDSSIDSSHNYIYISELGLGGVPSSSLSIPGLTQRNGRLLHSSLTLPGVGVPISRRRSGAIFDLIGSGPQTQPTDFLCQP